MHKLSKSIHVDGLPIDIHKASRVLRHTPHFEWGIQSPGTAQLALALLLEVLPEKEAIAHRFVFAAEVVARYPRNSAALHVSKEDILVWAKNKQQKK